MSARSDGIPAIEKAQRIRLDLEGMTCASCAAAIERSLNRLDGVEATVNLATEQASVRSGAGILPAALIEAVESIGYGARVADPEGTARDLGTFFGWRLVLAVLLTVPVIVLAMAPGARFSGWEWVALGLSAPVVFVAGSEIHRAGFSGIRHASPNMDTLVSIGALAAWTWSAVVLAVGLHTGTYFEVGGVVTTLVLLGRALEAGARRRSSEAIRLLAGLSVREVRLIRDGREELVPADELVVGDLFVVKPGERVATDGDVVDGSSSIDTSMLTGEPVPVVVHAGAKVTGGTLTVDGRILVRATRVGSETVLARIRMLVDEAQSGKAGAQRLADRVSAVFVPAVVGVAILTLAGRLAFGGGAGAAFTAAVSVLIVACPCALGLATPTALMVGSGRGAQLGVLIRGPEVLERTRRLDTIVLDKTGTITEGTLELESVDLLNGASRLEVLRLGGAVEAASEHPVGAAVARAARAELGVLPAVSGFQNDPGRGVSGTVDGVEVTIGRSGPDVEVAWAGAPRARLRFQDRVKPSSATAVAELRALGLTPLLLTGDGEAAAREVAGKVGIDDVLAGVSPEAKAAEVERLRDAGRVVAMAGDGINDAAALAVADLGLAMGTGTDVAIEAADITLVSGDLRAAVDAIRLARATLRTIEWNLGWAFAYNVAAIPLAIAGVVNPIVAAAAMACSSLFVVGNSLRLRRFRSVRAA